MSGFIHARTFETRWGQGLAFLDNDDSYESEVLVLRVWAPLCDDGSLACADVKSGLRGNVTDAAIHALEAANRSALVDMDAAKFEAGLDRAGIGTALDKAFADHPGALSSPA